jgi:hypothetical protein
VSHMSFSFLMAAAIHQNGRPLLRRDHPRRATCPSSSSCRGGAHTLLELRHAPMKGPCLVLVIEGQPKWTNCV